jgi:hypothetical protein
MTDNMDETRNAQLVTEGLARVAKRVSVDVLVSGIHSREVIGGRMLPGMSSSNDSLSQVALRRCRIDDDPDPI